MASPNSNATGTNGLEEQSFNMKTIQDRMKHLLATGQYSDVHFVFVNNAEEKEIIKAHKLVLVPASPYFAARFRFDNNASPIAADNQQQQIVVIDDIEAKPSAFRAVLNFLYANDVSLINADNFSDVYELSKKCMLPHLTMECVEELASTMLNVKNVLTAWRMAKMHDETALVNQCLALIDDNKMSELLATDEFKSLNQYEVAEIFGRDTLHEAELDLFHVLNRWAIMKHAEEHPNGIEPTAEEKRAIIGPALYAIRFPLISPKDFTNQIVPTGILDKDEMMGMFLHYAEDSSDDVKAKYPLTFPTNRRAILPSQEHNKLVQKADFIRFLKGRKTYYTQFTKRQEAQNTHLGKLLIDQANEVRELRSKLEEANNRLRACGQDGVEH